jgi:hypothetical protein
MKPNAKKCVSLVELWKNGKADKVDAPFYYRQYLGQDRPADKEWGPPEQIPMETISL